MELKLKNPKYTDKLIYLRKLQEKLGKNVDMAELIGCSAPHIGQCLSGNVRTLKAYELAAEAVYKRMFGENSDKQAIISAPDHVLMTIESLVKNLGGKFKHI